MEKKTHEHLTRVHSTYPQPIGSLSEHVKMALYHFKNQTSMPKMAMCDFFPTNPNYTSHTATSTVPRDRRGQTSQLSPKSQSNHAKVAVEPRQCRDRTSPKSWLNLAQVGAKPRQSRGRTSPKLRPNLAKVVAEPRQSRG